jgi:ABC-type antimicrobial peptide transport system permease subunit
MLYDVGASNTFVYASAAVVVAIVAVVSSWAPARSATKVDPAIALRAE